MDDIATQSLETVLLKEPLVIADTSALLLQDNLQDGFLQSIYEAQTIDSIPLEVLENTLNHNSIFRRQVPGVRDSGVTERRRPRRVLLRG